MQVSAFGNDKESDHLDNWEVQFSGSQWSQDQKVVQIFVCMNNLSSNGCKRMSCEIFCHPDKGKACEKVSLALALMQLCY